MTCAYQDFWSSESFFFKDIKSKTADTPLERRFLNDMVRIGAVQKWWFGYERPALKLKGIDHEGHRPRKSGKIYRTHALESPSFL